MIDLDKAWAFEPVVAVRRGRERTPADARGVFVGRQPELDLLAGALIELGELDAADAFLRVHEAQVRERGRRSMTAKLACCRGRLESARGERARAQDAFGEALAEIEPLGMPYEQARIEVAFGQFRRRDGQRRAAAAELTAAKERLEALGALPLLERCNRELEACGLTPTARKGRVHDALTPQEHAVARLAAADTSNRDIAAELLLSVKTVERHLTHVFAKLGIRSRADLPPNP